jgi:hypothetical protein
VGRDAFGTNTTGSGGVAIGYEAGKLNLSASYNVAIGYRAMITNSTGTGNTSLGYVALYTATGNNNTAIGALTLDAVTTGVNNSALGYNAGSSLTSGDNCLLLGNEAGMSGSPGGSLTTQDNEIVLGDENITEAHIQVDWTVASDKRDKTDVEPLKPGLDFVKKLEPVTYKWDKRSKYVPNGDDFVDVKPDGTHKESWLDSGFLAQDVEALEAEYGHHLDDETNLATSRTDDGKQYGLTYTKFIPILVKAIQEQSVIIDALTARLEILEGV